MTPGVFARIADLSSVVTTRPISIAWIGMPCLCLFIPAVNGTPFEQKLADSPSANRAFPHSQSAFTGWPYIVFSFGVLLIAHILANKKGRVPVWGSMMAVWAFAWWGIRDDAATSLWLSGT